MDKRIQKPIQTRARAKVDPTGIPPTGIHPSSTDENSTSNGTTNQTTAPYTATSKRIERIRGTVVVDVEIPQVKGGNPDVATVFNDEMQRALLAQADSLTAATLKDGPGSGVRIGERVLSGLLRTASTKLLDGQIANW